MRKKIFIILVLLGGFTMTQGHSPANQTGNAEPDKLAVLWASGDPEVAHKVCLMYTHAAKKNHFFKEVTLIIWGPSSRLLAADKAVQEKVKSMADDGVTLVACIACADSYGVSDTLRDMGIEVKPMGRPLTDMLKQGWKVLTF
jgi:hypothetical protein